jgi:hypothetical protein
MPHQNMCSMQSTRERFPRTLTPTRALGILALALGSTFTGAVPLAAAQGSDLEDARARWAGLDPEDRRQLHERFRQYQALSPEARQALQRRAIEVRRHRDRLVGSLPETWWEAARAHGERGQAEDVRHQRHQRHPMLRRWQQEGALLDGRALERRLPRDLREQLEAARPGERPLVWERWREEREARFQERVLAELGAALELAPERVEALRAMERAERRTELLALRRELIRRQIARGTAGAGIEPERWAELETLGDREFFSAWREELRVQFAQRIEALRGPGPHGEPDPRPDLVEAVQALSSGPEGRRTRLLLLLRPEGRGSLEESLEGHPRLSPEQRHLLLEAEPAELLEVLRHLAPRRPFGPAQESAGPRRGAHPR